MMTKAMGWILRWVKRLLLVYLVMAICVFAYQWADVAFGNPDADLVDNSAAGRLQRQTEATAIVELLRKQVTRYRTPEYHRDAHAKAHGCVRAEFEVLKNEQKLRYGIFQKPATYQAWIRFSNGAVPALDDTKKDARGMAIKVMNVDGRQLLPPPLPGRTQDFIMINSPAFFIRSISNYHEISKFAAEGNPYTYFFGKHYINPLDWHFYEFYAGLKTRKKAPATPLSTQYFSMTPYQLGPHQMKFSAKACENYQAPGVDYTEPNFLRDAMRKVLKSQDACFDFMVQLKDPDDVRMPIQDATVEWSQKKSPFVTVARVYIPRQEFDTPEQNTMCENLSFNPWHGVEEQRPLSYFNELRRQLYLRIAAYRQVRNEVLEREPNSWCDSLDRYCDKRSTDPVIDTTNSIQQTQALSELPAELSN